jgi:hypothetical protein
MSGSSRPNPKNESKKPVIPIQIVFTIPVQIPGMIFLKN